MVPKRVLVSGTTLLLAACGDGSDNGFPTTERPGKRSDIGAVLNTATDQILVFGGDNGPIVNQIPSPAYLEGHVVTIAGCRLAPHSSFH